MPTRTTTNNIIQGDCVTTLSQLPDRYADLVILDPPYWKVVHEKWDFQWRTQSDYTQWCFEWLTQISRVIKRSGSLYLFGYTRNLIPLYHRMTDLGFEFRQDIVVDKGIRALGGRATRGYKQFPNTTENLWFFIYDSKPFIRAFLKERQAALGLTAKEINERLGVKSNGGGMWSLYTGDNVQAQVPTEDLWRRLQEALEFDMPYSDIGHTFNVEMGLTNVWQDIDFYEKPRLHPTQKPVHLIERIIQASSKPDALVLDPFLGSGSTAIAALNTGRNYIGIEQDATYHATAVQRVRDHQISRSRRG